MKIRSGFVSNSSSSSFVLNKELLTPEQIIGLKNYIQVAEGINTISRYDFRRRSVRLQNGEIVRLGKYNTSISSITTDEDRQINEWKIEEKEKTVEGSCMLDEFDFGIFIEDLLISREAIVSFKCGNVTKPYEYPEPLDEINL